MAIMKFVCALLWHAMECFCVIAANVHACMRDYLSIDDDLPTHGVELSSTDDAPALDTPNDDDDENDPVPLGSELSDIQAVDRIVQLRYFMATKDNADCHIPALSNALDYIDEARLKANKQNKITDFFHM